MFLEHLPHTGPSEEAYSLAYDQHMLRRTCGHDGQTRHEPRERKKERKKINIVGSMSVKMFYGLTMLSKNIYLVDLNRMFTRFIRWTSKQASAAVQP